MYPTPNLNYGPDGTGRSRLGIDTTHLEHGSQSRRPSAFSKRSREEDPGEDKRRESVKKHRRLSDSSDDSDAYDLTSDDDIPDSAGRSIAPPVPLPIDRRAPDTRHFQELVTEVMVPSNRYKYVSSSCVFGRRRSQFNCSSWRLEPLRDVSVGDELQGPSNLVSCPAILEKFMSQY